jgi:hypothetical protein
MRAGAWWRDWTLLRHLLILEAMFQGRVDIVVDLEFGYV